MIANLYESAWNIGNIDRILEERTLTDNANGTDRNMSIVNSLHPNLKESSSSFRNLGSAKRSASKYDKRLSLYSARQRLIEKAEGERPDSALIL